MRAVASWLLAVVTVVVVTGCGSSTPPAPVTVPAPDTLAPLLLWTTPQPDPAAMPSATPTAIFSEPMKAESISSATFTLTGPDGAVDGAVTLSGDARTATFTPAAPLASGAKYTATLTTGAQDLAGNGLAAPVRWTFQTQPAPDQTRPTMVSVTPADGSTGNDGTSTQVSAQFSESLDCARVSAASLTVFELGVQVPGDVSCDGATLTFQPFRGLPTHATLQAFVSPAVEDLAGNSLGSGLQWAFQVRPWTKQIASSGADQVYATWMDASGARFIVGQTNGTFGDPPAGGNDVFVSKASLDGTRQWIHTVGSSAEDRPHGVTTDGAGNVVVAGVTAGSFPGQISDGGYDVFVVSYAPDGARRWIRQFGTSTDDFVGAVASDAAGNLYVGGTTRGALPGQTLTGFVDSFLVKFDASGTLLWTRQFGISSKYVQLIALAVSKDGSRIFVTGDTDGSFTGANAGSEDVFVRAYDPDGNIVWTSQTGTVGQDTPDRIALDATGSVLVSGMTGGTFSGQTSAGSFDVILLKLGPAGTPMWTRQFGTPGSDYDTSVAADPAGNVFVSSYSGQLPTLTKLDANGRLQWSAAITNQPAPPGGVAVDSVGDVFATLSVAGGFDGLASPGDYDVYVVKYDEDGHKR